MSRMRNYQAGNEGTETGVLVKSDKGRKVSVEGERMLSVESDWTVFKRRLLLYQPLRQSWTKSTIVLSCSKKRRHRLTEDNPRKVLVSEERASWKKRTKTVQKNPQRRKCTDPSCDYWHPPIRQNYKFEAGCNFGDQCLFGHTEADGQPCEMSKKSGGKGSVPILKESTQWGCVCPKITLRKCLFCGKLEIWDRIIPSDSSRAHGTAQKFGKEWVHRKVLCKSVNLKNAIRVRQNLRIGHIRKSCNKKDAPAAKHWNWREMSLSSKPGTRPRYTLLPKCRHPLRQSERSENSSYILEHQCTC